MVMLIDQLFGRNQFYKNTLLSVSEVNDVGEVESQFCQNVIVRLTKEGVARGGNLSDIVYWI